MKSFDNIRSKEDILDLINSKEFENLFNVLNSKEVSTLLDNALDNKMTRPQNEIYEEIAGYYVVLLRLLKIDDFNSFCFPHDEAP